MTPKQKLFIREYCQDLNATRAAIAAGYSKKTAAQAASRLLRNVKVSAEISRLTQKTCTKLEISAEYVLRKIRDTVERCSQSEPVLDAKGRPTGQYKFDAAAVLKGSELLGKHLKMFTDKVEHSDQIEQLDFSRLTDTQLEEMQRIVESADSDPKRRSE